jgi:hypothetical protein
MPAKKVVYGAQRAAPRRPRGWAPPGATLPGGRTLERKVRGVSSPALCSEVELNMSDEGDG